MVHAAGCLSLRTEGRGQKTDERADLGGEVVVVTGGGRKETGGGTRRYVGETFVRFQEEAKPKS